MATYCYTDGRTTIERWFPMGRAPKQFRHDGRMFRRDFTAEGVGVPSSPGWPMECVASGVHPSQAGELRKYFRDHGVPTEVSRDGNPIYTSAAHRRKALKCRGLKDRSSFF